MYSEVLVYIVLKDKKIFITKNPSKANLVIGSP